MHSNEKFALKDKITVLVNSCDTYEDLWAPFFTLFRKYWSDKDVRLLLNTESKVFEMDGLNIECVHFDKSRQYGSRMLHVLSKVTTEYVMILLDDFFLRKPVDTASVEEIIKWMDEDRNIVYFNSDCTETYADWEVNRYRGFRRIPPGTEYVLNLQAAIWRTDLLKGYWKPEISPWEWEEFSSLITAKNKEHKFYCVTDWSQGFCDYGYDPEGMGVFRGKWVRHDVQPLFEKEGISVDFSKRGFYDPEKDKGRIAMKSQKDWDDLLIRCYGRKGLYAFRAFRVRRKIAGLLGKSMEQDFFIYMREQARNDFLMNRR